MKKFDNFCKSLSNLREGLQLEEPYSVVERTGIIGLFEICFEQAWKLMKAVLEEHGRTIDRVGSPKVVIQLAYQSGMINDSEQWLSLLRDRNILAHTYSDEDSLAVIRTLKTDYEPLFAALKEEIETRWLSA